jgi:hypothetical protein
MIAQNYLFINYLWIGGDLYPLGFRRSHKEVDCEAREQPFRNHTASCCELADWVRDRQICGGFTMDCNLLRLDSKPRVCADMPSGPASAGSDSTYSVVRAL